MAYISGTTTGPTNNIDEFLAALESFLLANGWTAHDILSSTDKVFRSTGTGRERIYLRFAKSTNRIAINAYQFWNPTSHAGFNVGGTSATVGVDAGSSDTPFFYWAWTDGRVVVVCAKNGSTYNGGAAGAANRSHNSDVGFTTAGVLAGGNVTVPLDQSFPGNPDWAPGKKIMVLDQLDTYASGSVIPCEFATILAVSPTSVNLALSQNHAIGAMVGVDPMPVFVTAVNDITSAYFINDIGGYTTNGRLFSELFPFASAAVATDPNDRTGRHLVQQLFLMNTTVSYQELRGTIPGVLVPTIGSISSEDTTTVAGVAYVALPVGSSGRQVFVPTA